MARTPYPTDATDDEWAFAAPYLALMREDAPQRHHDLRDVFDALRWMARAGASRRLLPHDLPPWRAVYQQARRWIDANVFEQMAADHRVVLRVAAGRASDPTAAIVDSRTLRRSVESGSRAGYDGAKRTNGSKVHLPVDTLGLLLALQVSPANEQDRRHVGALARRCGRRPAAAWSWRSSTRATPARRRPPKRRASSCES